ncbi:MAG: carboxypeptidase-like regulatory domain-containing protein [Bacteroidota bacterium]
MKRLLVIIGLLMPMAASAQTPACFALTGTVRDAETEAPLPNAHVFIAASTLGTATDADGRFAFSCVPPGAHKLIATMLGFEQGQVEFDHRSAEDWQVDLELAPTIIEMDGAVVTAQPADRGRKWRKRLNKFVTTFVGETPGADKASIENTEVLDFKVNWLGVFRATASAPLVVRNEHLGYQLEYHMKDFSIEGPTIRYDGDPFYEHLAPASPQQEEEWVANRRQAFHGSFRHFLLAAMAGRADAEGFQLFYRPDLRSSAAQHIRFPARTADLLTPSDTLAGGMVLDFDGYVEIVYTREEENRAFRLWQRKWPLNAYENQRSLIKLTSGATVVDHNGEVLDPYGVTLYGYWAFERIAEDLPKEYRPPDFLARLQQEP